MINYRIYCYAKYTNLISWQAELREPATAQEACGREEGVGRIGRR